MIRTLRLVIDNDHIEQVAPASLHIPGRRNNILQFVLLKWQSICVVNSERQTCTQNHLP